MTSNSLDCFVDYCQERIPEAAILISESKARQLCLDGLPDMHKGKLFSKTKLKQRAFIYQDHQGFFFLKLDKI